MVIDLSFDVNMNNVHIMYRDWRQFKYLCMNTCIEK